VPPTSAAAATGASARDGGLAALVAALLADPSADQPAVRRFRVFWKVGALLEGRRKEVGSSGRSRFLSPVASRAGPSRPGYPLDCSPKKEHPQLQSSLLV